MKYSIRNLLVLLSAVAFGLAGWQTRQNVKQKQDRLEELMLEIQVVEQDLDRAMERANSIPPHLRQALEDEYLALHRLSSECDASFIKLQEKYGRVSPRDAKVVSVRSIPTLSSDSYESAEESLFRIFVPDESPVWIQCKVEKDGSRIAARKNETESLFWDKVVMGELDSYEHRLTPGFHTISISVSKIGTGIFGIQVDTETLLDLQLKSARSTHGYYSFDPQYDHKLDQDPLNTCLHESHFFFSDKKKISSPYECRLVVYLSNRSRSFKRFPGIRHE